jgi:hypothetical protein
LKNAELGLQVDIGESTAGNADRWRGFSRIIGIAMNTGLHLRYIGYIAITILWALAEWMTDGQYRVWFILFGGSLGFGIGLGTESFRATDEILSVKIISRATLYVVPLVFCDSLLLLINSLRTNSFIILLISIYMILSQMICIFFILYSDKQKN